MIKIRAHHLACIPRFYHGGYDKTFAKNMKRICLKLRKNPNTKIKITSEDADSLCLKCPHWHKKECTQSKEIGKWVKIQDKKNLKHLKLEKNSIHNTKEIFNLSIEKINPNTIEKVCKNCIFLENCIKVGINKSFQKDINKK